MTIIVLDTETTGLGHAAYFPRSDAVVQIGMAWRRGETVETWSEYCNPGKRFFANGRSRQAFAVNGLEEALIESSRPVKEVALDFWLHVNEIKDALGDEVEFRAYNRQFDEGFLAQKPWGVPSHKWGSCIMQQAALKLTGKSRLKLSKAMELLELKWPGAAHDAGNDAHAALLVHEKVSVLK